MIVNYDGFEKKVKPEHEDKNKYIMFSASCPSCSSWFYGSITFLRLFTGPSTVNEIIKSLMRMVLRFSGR